MKHFKLFFALFAMLALGVGNAWGAETLYKNALFKIANCTKNSSYTGIVTCTIGTDSWVAQNAANNDGGWDYVKIGAKKASGETNKVTTGTITTDAAYAEAVSKIVVNGQKDRGSFTSKLIIASNSSFTTDKVEITGATSFTNGQIVFEIASPSANKYYKLEFVCSNTTTTNGVIQVSSVEYYYEPSSEETVVSVPTFSVPEGTFYSPINVELSCSTADAEIHYTLDGNTPTSTSEKYTTAIAISETTTVKAIAVKDGLTDSEVATATYTKGETVTSYDIDFETNALEAYVNWDFSNITIAKTITAKGGTYYGNTSGKASASIKTKEQIQYPGKLTFSVSKESTNTTASNWLVQVSENGTTWSTVGTISATEMKKGIWNDHSVDLSDYENVYVQISYGSSTAVRAIDEISLAQGVAPVKYTLTIENPENGTLLVTNGGASVASGDQFKAGTSLVVTPTPASGYLFESLTVGGEAVELTDGSYTFTMPASDVTISATFKANEKPAATLTLSKNGDTSTKIEGKVGDVINLPDFESECSKTFVGWDADENCNHAPTYAPGAEYTLAAETQTLYAVYADGESGEASLTKMTSSDALANGDKIVIVANGTKLGMYQETTSTSYVKNWELGAEEPTISELDEKKIWDVVAVDGSWKLGDATNGYLYNSSSNNLAVSTAEASTWTIAWKTTGFTFKSDQGRYLACRTDLTTDKKNLYRMNGTSVSSTNGSAYEMDIYKYSVSAPSYSNYSTTCAAAPIATIDPTSITATAAGAEGKVTVTYENVNTEIVAVALFNDAACTEAFTAGWLTASIDADKNITYTVAENTTYAERNAYIQLTAPDAVAATDPAVVVIPVTQAGKDKVFASLEELLANITPTTTATKVTVTLTKEPIVEIYVSGTYRNGIYLNVPYQGSTKKIEIYSRDVPAEWIVGGSVSGTLANCDWKDYNGTWELCPADWSELTYQEPKAVSTIVVSGAPTKTAYVDGEAFDPTGLTVTVNYNDATTEVNPTGVTFTVTPTTLVKSQTSVSVTATFNSVTSAAYEVTGLTVNDIPTKTVAEFIEAGGTRCYLEGIVSGLTEGNSMKYGNFDLTDASGTIYVYGCLNASGEKEKFAELGVKNGDKIKVIADEYELYGGTKHEAKNVQYVSHVSAASITISDITMEVGETKTIAATVVPAEAEVTYTIKENAANAISLSGNTITALAEGTATITATVAEGATYLGNSVDFTVTVGPKTESDEVVILAELDGKWYAMKGEKASGTGQIAALEVTYFNGILYDVNDADKSSITWTRTVVGDKVTFANNGKYLKGTSGDTNLALDDSKCEWTFNGTTYTIGNRTFLYRENYNFKNYSIEKADASDAQGNYSALPVVTAPVYATGDITYTRNVTNKYGTICLPYASASTSGAYFYEVVGKGTENGKPAVYLASVDALVAGVPYIFEKTANTITVTCQGEAVAEAGSANGLVGNFTNEFIVPANNYILYNNAFILADGTTNKVNANRAYLVMEDVEGGKPVQMPGRRYIGMGVQGENGTTGLDNIMTTDAPAKVIINGQLIIIRNGEKYNVQGQKL